MVDGLVITGSALPIAEPSEVRLPMTSIASALAFWLKRETAIAQSAAIGNRPLLFMKPPTFLPAPREGKNRFWTIDFLGEGADLVPVLLARNLPLHERIIG